MIERRLGRSKEKEVDKANEIKIRERRVEGVHGMNAQGSVG